MRRLAESTIRKGLNKIGFENQDNGTGMWLLKGQTTAARLFLKFEDSNIIIRDGRWTKAPNVHVVSYFYWPTSMKKLEEMAGEIMVTYSELCGTKFKGEPPKLEEPESKPHSEDCKLHKAMNRITLIECVHGHDVCPICDPCTCAPLKQMPTVTPRETYEADDGALAGYDVSLREWVDANQEAVEWFLENAEAIRKKLEE